MIVGAFLQLGPERALSLPCVSRFERAEALSFAKSPRDRFRHPLTQS
jgi:hypothetical protein